MKKQQKDPLIDKMDNIAGKLLSRLDSDMFAEANTDQKIEITKLDIEAFNSVGKWISVKNRIDDEGEGDGIGHYQQILKKPAKRGSHHAKGSSGVSQALDAAGPRAIPPGIRAIQARLAAGGSGGHEGDRIRAADAADGAARELYPDGNGDAQSDADDPRGDARMGFDDLSANRSFAPAKQ